MVTFPFIGGTCHLFRRVYLIRSGNVTIFQIKIIVSSASCVELYLKETGTSAGAGTCILQSMWICATKYDRVDILEWAHQRGYSHDMDKHIFYSAAKYGELDALRWLRDHTCPWDRRTCCSSTGSTVSTDHLRPLQWAKENECPWDSGTCTNTVPCHGG